MPPNLANARLHWAVKYKRQNAWAAHAIVAEPKLRGQHTPMARAQVTAVLYPYNPMDDDNAVARLKWPLDLLVRRQIIAGDQRPECELTGIPVQHIDRKRPRIELTIQEVPAS